ncbi:MAG: MBL fold metallo-hydrolase [Alcanivoracaceae bacterium]|nr:MBL fold metallo-hydrolase [Alcanivoracaceae bacterium]
MFALTPGQPVQIAEGVWRLLALNPGMMSGPGTNTYLIRYLDGLIVLDPGPEDPRHVINIEVAAQQLSLPVKKILVTHTHRDHSPAAHALHAQTGAPLCGPGTIDDNLQDERWHPHEQLADGDKIELGHSTLTVISTPGHVGNHLCYLLESEGMLFSGDHLINGSTVVIAPPSGSMSAYLKSLEKLLPFDIHVIAPGHGDLIHQPKQAVEQTISHRLKREHKVRTALSERPNSSASELVKVVYDDTPAFLHPIAEFSLLAHLIKLCEDGVAVVENSRYTLTESA